jgi:hypothetical protein
VNWLTVVLVAVLALATWRAYRNGFVRELVSLCSVILAIPIAGLFYRDLYPKVQPIVGNETLAGLVSFLAILAGVVVGGQVVAHLLKAGVSMLNLGALDQLAGGAFGFLKAALLCQVILIALIRFPRPDIQGPIDGSPVARGLLDSAPLVLAVLPGHFHDALDAFLDGVQAASGFAAPPALEGFAS